VTPEALLDLFVLSPVGLAEVDVDGRVEVSNLAARSLLAPLVSVGAIDNLWVALAEVAPEVPARARAFDASRGVVVERLEVLAPGDNRGVVLSLVKTSPDRFVAVIADATDLALARGTCVALEQQLRAVENAVHHHAILTVDANGVIQSWSESAARLHQYSADGAVGKPLSILLPTSAGESHVRDMLERATRNDWCEDEGQRRREDGTLFHASTVITALRDARGTTQAYSVVTRDLSDQRKLENVLRDDATSNADYLTGVTSQRSFVDVASSEVARARRYGQPLTLLLVDPDNFRDLAETYGSTFTDECLRAIASACRHESRNTDVVGRVGGEQFAVLLPSTELAGGLVLAERIRERIHRHVFSGDLASVRCTLSIGVAELGNDDASVERLLAEAATAVQRAQAAGRNLVVGFDA
jgi:diguanylate cyclase (GGDEF)-like protein/PAS domain S-box-containing protein